MKNLLSKVKVKLEFVRGFPRGCCRCAARAAAFQGVIRTPA
jgi:hypothetical protein